MDISKAHAINPVSGMLEPTGNYPTAFDSDRKKRFLELYKLEELGIRRACRRMGLSVSTVNHHLQIDQEFKRLFDECEKEYIENLECTSRSNALNPKSVIERIFQLKCLLPLKYGQENKPVMQNIIVNIDQNAIEHNRNRVNAIEAEVVTELEQSRKQIHQSVDYQCNPV